MCQRVAEQHGRWVAKIPACQHWRQDQSERQPLPARRVLEANGESYATCKASRILWYEFGASDAALKQKFYALPIFEWQTLSVMWCSKTIGLFTLAKLSIEMKCRLASTCKFQHSISYPNFSWFGVFPVCRAHPAVEACVSQPARGSRGWTQGQRPPATSESRIRSWQAR